MRLLKQGLSILVAVQMAVLPMVAYGQISKADQEKLVLYQKTFGETHEVRFDKETKRAFLYERNASRDAQPIVEIPLEDKKTLRAFSPKNLEKKLLKEMQLVKTAGKGAWSHTMNALPAESALFFIAMGSLVAFNMSMNPGQNPVGYQQHIEHQLSPLGIASFGMFMFSQAFTTNMIRMWTLRPALLAMAPYNGMTIGMWVQTYFSQMAADPSVSECIKQGLSSPYPWTEPAKVKKGYENACEQAYETYVIHHMMFELAPATISMLLSSVVAAGVEQGISYGAKNALEKQAAKDVTEKISRSALVAQAGKKMGLSTLVWLFPGGVQVRGMRWFVSRTLQIAGWGALDMWMNQHITRIWKNQFDGKELANLNDDLVKVIEINKKTTWNPLAGLARQAELQKFAEKMHAWRQTNLAKVLEAHQAWQQNLGALNSSYYATYSFYQKFTSEIKEPRDKSKLNKSYPYYGVLAKDLTKEQEVNYFLFPGNIEYLQIMTTEEVARIIERKLTDGTYKSLGLRPTELTAMSELQKGLSNKSTLVKVEAIKKMNALMPLMAHDPNYSRAFNNEVRSLYSVLGKAEPLMEKGRGFGYTLVDSPTDKANYSDARFLPVTGSFETTRLPDYMVASMICGPQLSKGEQIISMPKGFQAHFHAFSITEPHAQKAAFCGGQSAVMGSDKLYTLKAGPYKGAIEYIQSNIQMEPKYNFINWWNENTDKQIHAAYDTMKLSYNNIIQDLFKGIYRGDLDDSNDGPVYNGTMVAAFQEARVYLVILGEIFKDAYKEQYKKDLPNEFFVPGESLAVSLTDWKKSSSQRPFVSLLSQESSLDFDSLISYKAGARLQIQREIESQLAVLNGFLKKISFRKDSSGKMTYVYSGFTKEQLESQNKNLEASLKKLNDLLGVEEAVKAQKNNANTTSPTAADIPVPDDEELAKTAAKVETKETKTESKSLVKLSYTQGQIAKQCLSYIQAVGNEITMYGQIANAVKVPEQKK